MWLTACKREDVEGSALSSASNSSENFIKKYFPAGWTGDISNPAEIC